VAGVGPLGSRHAGNPPLEAAEARSCSGSIARIRSRRRPEALNAYFDTSAVINLVVAEDGSDLADELWDAAEVRISSQLLYPEARAALAATARAGRIDRLSLHQAVADLDAATASMVLVGVDGALARHAGQLAEEHALRGCDAVHLATALSSVARGTVVVSWDRDLAAAALRCGYAVAPRLQAAG